jgi:uncharacterized protein (TIGR00251 family)
VIALTPHAEGCILPVRAQPGARKNAVVGEYGGALKLAVAAPPDKGRANKALTELLRDVLALKRSQVEIVSGDTSQDKKFLIRGLTVSELQARLALLLP